MKIGYFNIGFVSLRYKTTNQPYTKYIEKYTRKSQNFLEKFLEFFNFFKFVFGAKPDPT